MEFNRIVDVVANGFKRIEELDTATTILQGFPRSIQFDEHSCGMHAVYGILRYYSRIFRIGGWRSSYTQQNTALALPISNGC